MLKKFGSLKNIRTFASALVNKAIEIMNRDVAQLVSAPALGAGGPAFESQYPDRKSTYRNVSAFFVFPTYHQCSTQGMIFESNEQNPHYQRYNHTLGPRVHVTRAPGVKNNIPKKGYRKVILS